MRKFIIIFVIGIIVGLLAALLYNKYMEREQVPEPSQPVQDQPTQQADINVPGVLPVTYTITDNLHEIEGTLTLPDPCYRIEKAIQVAESFPEQVTVELTTLRDSDEFCAQVLTDKEFYVSFQASEEAKVTFKINGEEVELQKSKNNQN